MHVKKDEALRPRVIRNGILLFLVLLIFTLQAWSQITELGPSGVCATLADHTLCACRAARQQVKVLKDGSIPTIGVAVLTCQSRRPCGWSRVWSRSNHVGGADDCQEHD